MTVGVFDVFFAFLAFVDLSLEVVEAVILSQMRQFGGIDYLQEGPETFVGARACVELVATIVLEELTAGLKGVSNESAASRLFASFGGVNWSGAAIF